MRNLFTVMTYTIKEAVSKKVFIVTNLIMCLIIIAAFNIPNIMNIFNQDQKEDQKEKVWIIDQEGILGPQVENIMQTSEIPYQFEVKNTISQEEAKQAIEKEEADAAIYILKKDEAIQFKYIIKNSGMNDDIAAERFAEIIKNIKLNHELQQINAPADTIMRLNMPISYEIEQTNGSKGNNFVIAMVASFILFFAVYFYGYSVSSSVSSEKTSRVMEILVTSTNPASIVIGKTLGMGIVGLLQLIGLMLVAFLSFKLCIPQNYTDIIQQFLQTTNISLGTVVMVVVYFILGYTVYAFLNAVTGATVSKAEDIQSANMPISFIALASFYLAYFTAMVPNGSASKFASMFPFSSAFSMPGRILAGGVGGGEIALSIMILLVTAIILAYISIKVYSAAILHYGNRLKLSDLFQMFKQK